MSLNLEIISPQKVIFSGEVEMAVLPGEEGDFGVLYKHSPLLAQLKAGEIKVYDNVHGNGVPKTFSIQGGFAQTDGSICTVLSDEIEEAS